MYQQRLILAMFVAAFGVERTVQAEVKNWFGGTGTFGVDANWVPSGVPTSADEAMFGGGPYVVSFDKDEPSLRAISSAKASFDLNSFAYELPDFIEFNASSETRVEDGTITADRVLIDALATVSVGNDGVLAATSAFHVSSSGVLLIEAGGVASSGGDFDFQNGPLLGIDAGAK